MNSMLIENFNSLVKPEDTIYHLGDFCFSKDPSAIRRRLNGNIHLIKGNHDNPKQLQGLFGWIKDTYSLRVGKHSFWLAHYAHRVWPGSYRGAIHLYGHSHGNLDDNGRSTDVGVDCWDYKPVHIDTIIKMMEKKPVRPSEETSEETD